MRYLKLFFGISIALLPSWMKIPLYRVCYGYQIGRGVRIGFSPLIGIGQCKIGDRVRIGHLNLFWQIQSLEIGDDTRIGIFNLFRGGSRVTLGSYVTILRLNTFNAILEADFLGPTSPILELGTGTFIAAGHWFDFSDGISFGNHCIVGGRNSSFWTHNRQRGRSIKVGCHTYLGSEVRVAPGAIIPAFSIVGLGSVLIGRIDQTRVLIGGNPAAIVRSLEERDLFLVIRKTRHDIPDAVAMTSLPADLRERFSQADESGTRQPKSALDEPIAEARHEMDMCKGSERDRRNGPVCGEA